MRHQMVGVISLVLAGLCGCAEEVKTAPEVLVQTWHPKAQHMKDRSLEIRREWVVFGRGKFALKMYPLVRVEEESHVEGTHYTLYYTGDGNDERQLGVLHRQGNPQTLRLDNRDELWVRTQDATWLEEKTS